ncbi:ABC transporter substrate-binding protein [Epidermidibacterium keratini]|uniref:ABC transporter substrate-binding protein n=1 Tax=Epidermidibacterium keratini TaxID=1891644 RepID=A0A7L4YM67_9ACTN|nr:ABC transporter substrate-binding protein [Epidermidibacterium keratini]QHC00375.1 ABC transporter substrate-binding protein [Epidermidibacterium keratini]
MRKTASLVVACTAAAALTLSACSTKAADNSGSGGGGKGDVKTDFGVTDDTITLGVLTDMSGIFKATGLAATQGNQLWVDEINAEGGICGRQIKLNVQDHGYKADNAIPLYDKIREDILGIIQLNGSPPLAALKQRLTNDNILAVPTSTASANLDSPAVLMVGQTYDIETINGLSLLKKEGKIAEGDKIGHIYVDSEYGQNALLGSKYFTEQNGMELVSEAVSASDTDMTATMTKLKNEGVKAIAVSVTPGALGSIALQNVNQGLNVPLVGNNPTYSVTLLDDPAVEQALQNYYFVNSVAAYGTPGNPLAEKITKEYDAKYTEKPEKSIPSGYIFGMTFGEVLKQACEDGDLSRAGIMAAREKVTSIDTQGMTGAIDLSKSGEPTTREAYVLVVDSSTPTGLKNYGELFGSEEAKSYKAPYQK